MSASTGGSFFPDSKPTGFDRIESRISGELWRWVTSEPSAQAEITAPQSDLAIDVEYFLTYAFREIESTRARNLWCDGVLRLLIFQLAPVSFRMVAAAFCPGALEPVELEFHYPEVGSLKPLRILLRFGFADEDRTVRTLQRKGFDAGAILANLPPSKQEWAVAVELTSID